MPAAATLLVTYRNRPQHLRTLLTWYADPRRALTPDFDLLIIEAAARPSAQRDAEQAGARYVFVPSDGLFHKTRALNAGLQLSQSRFVVPYDVDLIPYGDTLQRHLKIAASSPLLVTGYRLMLEEGAFERHPEPDARIAATTPPEDSPGSLKIQLVNGEPFGVCPFFERQRLLDRGSWDERFVGWGGEDQDMIDRFLGADRFLVRSPHLLYFHLPHPPDSDWREPEIVSGNQRLYDQR